MRPGLTAVALAARLALVAKLAFTRWRGRAFGPVGRAVATVVAIAVPPRWAGVALWCRVAVDGGSGCGRRTVGIEDSCGCRTRAAMAMTAWGAVAAFTARTFTSRAATVAAIVAAGFTRRRIAIAATWTPDVDHRDFSGGFGRCQASNARGLQSRNGFGDSFRIGIGQCEDDRRIGCQHRRLRLRHRSGATFRSEAQRTQHIAEFERRTAKDRHHFRRDDECAVAGRPLRGIG